MNSSEEQHKSITAANESFSIQRRTESAMQELTAQDASRKAPAFVSSTIHDAFAKVVKRNSDQTAVVFEGKHVSYAALHEASTRLAQRLLAKKVATEEIVAISAERSVELIVGILAILKAGCAYLPLDPEYPRDRLQYMLADSGARLLLAHEEQAGMFRGLGVEEIIIRLEERAGTVAEPPLRPSVSSHNLAYLIYTSGSTGRPKGIMVPHKAVVNHVYWRSKRFDLNRSDRTLQRTPISFDISVWEIFSSLLTGGTLILPRPGAQKESACLVDVIVEQEITNFQIVPSMLKLMLQEPKIGRCRSLRWVFSGGEALSGDVARRFQETLEATLVNVYGPTETTIDTTFHICDKGTQEHSIPIGRAISDTTAFVVAPDGTFAAGGQEGTLLVGGRGLARGYWRRADRTAESFVPNAFADTESPGERLYNTGDVVRLTGDGVIQFVGRKDSQVKVRGFRIELQEIEHALKSCPLVADGVVMVRTGQGGDKKIVGYYVLKTNENRVTVNAVRHTWFHEIREYLAARLPDYMVPHHLVNIDALPLLPNGKLNTKALPEPAYYRSVPKESARPQNEKEQLVAQIWGEVLGVPEVACDELFAYYGGDSLQMVQVRLLAQKRGLFIDPSLRHHSATVRSLATAALWMKDRSVSARVLFRELLRFLKLFLQTKRYELRDVFRQWQTARLERPDRKRFQEFYEKLENQRDIYYLFVRRGLVHWLAKQVEFVPDETNLVIIGTAMTPEEQSWIRQNIERPFFHSELEIDHNSAWEFLFETNQHNFGWLEIGCFVNNSNLFSDLAKIDDDVAFNCVYTHTERHRRTFMEFFLFVNIRAIRAVQAQKIKVSPARHSYDGKVRREHHHAYHRVPRGKDRALLRRMLREEAGEEAKGLRGQIGSQKIFELYFFIGHLFYLYAQPLGFRIKRVRHLTAPTHVNYYNFFSDEVILPLHISRYEVVYHENGPKFKTDFDVTLQAEYMVLRSLVDKLPSAYAKRLWNLEVKILGRGLPLWDAGKNLIDYLVNFGVSQQVFDRPQWNFLKADLLTMTGGESSVTVTSL